MASSKNIGDQIFNAVQNAVDSQDFSNLQSTIEKSIGIAAEGIARSLSSASDGIRRGREQYALAQAKKRREEQMATIYANPSGQRSVGIALVGWGVVLGVPGLAGTIFTIGAGSILVGSILAAATVAGGALFAMGIKRLNLVNRFERYRDTIGLRDFCYLDEIAASTADTTENVRQNVKAMLSHGLFKQAALGDGENFLALTNDAYQQYRQARGKALERNSNERSRKASIRSLTPKRKPCSHVEMPISRKFARATRQFQTRNSARRSTRSNTWYVRFSIARPNGPKSSTTWTI